MNKNIFASVLVPLLLAACAGGKPPAPPVKEYLKALLRAQYGGGVELTALKVTGEKGGDVFGVPFHDVYYSYDILCNVPVQGEGFKTFSTENVILLDEFLKAQKGPWEKIDFTPVMRLKMRMSAEELKSLSDAYAVKKSLLLCKPGENASLSGAVRFMLKDGGWEASPDQPPAR
ncbi:MAG: hypothetical protein M0011_01180 [Elusimicrobia bacterium]|nr:hypothetical protein [Elusimicrobiota bacterium]